MLPFGGSIATHRKEKHIFEQKLKKLSVDELKDFRVPLQVYKDNAKAVSKSCDAMKNRILRAVGIDVSSKHAKIDWETFLLVNKVMSLQCEDRDTQINFAVRLFDPAWTGLLSASEFEQTWSGIFQQDEPAGEIGEARPDVNEDFFGGLEQAGVYKRDGLVKPESLFWALKNGLLDLDSLIHCI